MIASLRIGSVTQQAQAASVCLESRQDSLWWPTELASKQDVENWGQSRSSGRVHVGSNWRLGRRFGRRFSPHHVCAYIEIQLNRTASVLASDV